MDCQKVSQYSKIFLLSKQNTRQVIIEKNFTLLTGNSNILTKYLTSKNDKQVKNKIIQKI